MAFHCIIYFSALKVMINYKSYNIHQSLLIILNMIKLNIRKHKKFLPKYVKKPSFKYLSGSFLSLNLKIKNSIYSINYELITVEKFA